MSCCGLSWPDRFCDSISSEGSPQPQSSALPLSGVWHFRWCGVVSWAVRCVGFPKAFPPVRSSPVEWPQQTSPPSHVTHSEPVVGYGFSSLFTLARAERVEVPRWTLVHLLKITCLDSDLGLKAIPAINGFELTVSIGSCFICFQISFLYRAFHVQVLFKQLGVVLEA